MRNILSIFLILGLLLIPITVNAAEYTFTIPSDVTFPNGAKIQFKNTCSNPVIVRVADEKQAMSLAITRSNNAIIYQGGTYKLVCSDKTPPLKLEESIGPFLRYSPTTKTLWLSFNNDFDPESGIDWALSTLTVNGQHTNITIEGNWINLGTTDVRTVEYNFVNGQGLSTGKQTYTFPSIKTFREPNISIKPNTIIDAETIKKQVPVIHRDTNNNLTIEGIEGSTVKGFSRGSLYGNPPTSLTKEHYSINSNKITFLYNKTPNNTYISRATILFSDNFVPEYEYQFMPNQIYNLAENFKVQHQGDKLVITTKGFGLPLGKIGIDHYYFYVDSLENNSKAMPSSYAVMEGVVHTDNTERTFTIDLSKLKSGKYRLMMYVKAKDYDVQLHNYIADVYVSTPKQSTSAKAYSITIDKDTTTVKINPGATISGIKINGTQAITMNNSIATLSFDTMQIPNWAYDTIEPVVTSYNPPAPKPEPITSTTIILRIGSKNMYVNGKLVVLDSVPIIRNDRTLLPIRFVAEALGAQVGWDGATQKVTIQDRTTKIEMWINKPTALVNGKTVYIDPANHKVTPILVNARTMVPVRFVAETLGATVEWNEKLQQVTITK